MKALTKLLDLLILAIAAIISIVSLPFVAVLFVAFFKKIYEVQIFSDVESGFYGLRKAHWAKNFVISAVLPISQVVDLVGSLVSKSYKPLLYRQHTCEFYTIDPAALTGETDESVKLRYLKERCVCLLGTIESSGWRRVFVRYVIEMPTNTTMGEEGRLRRLTKFTVY